MGRAETSWTRALEREATIGAGFEAEGIGLHTGRKARVRVRPAATGTGIVLRRAGAGCAPVKAEWRNRQHARLCTALSDPPRPPIRTVEHLLAACAALGIDNLEVELDGDELPIFDGSAVPWCHSMLKAGLVVQDAPRRYLRIRRPVEVREPSGHFLRAEPTEAGDRPCLDIRQAFAGFEDMRWSGVPTPWVFLRDIAPSRSFGLLRWGLPLKLLHLFSREPLLRGASLFTTGIVWRGRFIGGMHVEDEPVRHRVLDLMGDLALAGLPIIARINGYCPRHDLNHAFVRAIMTATDAWDVVALRAARDGSIVYEEQAAS